MPAIDETLELAVIEVTDEAACNCDCDCGPNCPPDCC
jgi:hypothetical protein